MASYTVNVTINDVYDFDDVLNADEAIQVAKNCVADNYSRLEDDMHITYSATRTDIPEFGDATDAGIAGE